MMTMQIPAPLVPYVELLMTLHEQQHCGAFTTHLQHGKPKAVEFPREPQRIRLDSVTVTAVELTR